MYVMFPTLTISMHLHASTPNHITCFKFKHRYISCLSFRTWHTTDVCMIISELDDFPCAKSNYPGHVCLYVYEYALLERWVYFLCYVSCISFFLPICIDFRIFNYFYLDFALISPRSFFSNSKLRILVISAPSRFDDSFQFLYNAILHSFNFW